MKRCPLAILVITFLSLSSCHINKTAEGVHIFDSISDDQHVTIYLKDYHLQEIPDEIGMLTKATSLYIGNENNRTGWTLYPPLSAMSNPDYKPSTKELNPQITKLTGLRSLHIEGLDIGKLPADFCKLKNLDTLDLSINRIVISQELPKLKALRSLKYLLLEGNIVTAADTIELKAHNPKLRIASGLGK